MYVFRRGGSFYFEYSHEHRRIRRGGFPTKTLAKLAGEEDRRRLRLADQERGREGPPKADEGRDCDAFLERGRQSNVVGLFEAARSRRQRSDEEPR